VIRRAPGWWRGAGCAALLLATGLLRATPAFAQHSGSDKHPGTPPLHLAAQGIFVLDGSFVHTAGELQVNITNWGLIGSHPGTREPYSDAPSAMWPAGSGVDYLFSAGLWVGAIKNGIPLVSTGQPETELLPSGDPTDVIYSMSEGEPGGHRYPLPDDDDDGDGRVDEDPKDGIDNDGDGRIDEDYAAIGNQEFRCVMRDDTALAREAHPDHDPLGIEIVQETFQWESPELEDFLALRFTVHNVTDSPLEDVCMGLYFDADIGPRDRPNVGQDDIPGRYAGVVDLPDGTRVPISLYYMYDCDGDGGLSPGYIGVMIMGPRGTNLPAAGNVRAFSRTAPFDSGGEPKNDEERYVALTSTAIRPIPTDCRDQNDWRLLIADPRISFLPPHGRRTFEAVMVIGKGLEDLKLNAGRAAEAFFGGWFDRDGDPQTGRDGYEHRVCEREYHPPSQFYMVAKDCWDPNSLIVEVDLDAEKCTWIDGDCSFEIARGAVDCHDNGGAVSEELLLGCTGVNGRESNVTWWVEGLPPPPPRLRLWETNDRVHLFWDDRSERSTDLKSGVPNFESYGIWRADRWKRPPGTSERTGPATALWAKLAEFDVVDSFQQRTRVANGQIVIDVLPLGRNTGLQALAYVPLALRPGSPAEASFRDLADLLGRIVAEHPELTAQDHVRYRATAGEITPLGLAYPDLARWECCYDQVDTLYADRFGVRYREYVDRGVHNGQIYFHSVTAGTRRFLFDGARWVTVGLGPTGQPRGNFLPDVPKSDAQTADERRSRGQNIYVVPNPATRAALAEFSQLHPNSEDPTGVRVEFRNLPQARSTIQIFTLSGDRVTSIDHDGTVGDGSASWNLVSRNGQEVTSGIYLYSVECDDARFARVVGRFVVIR
jgi:hypothetical protein